MTKSCPACGTRVSFTGSDGLTKHRTRLLLQEGDQLALVCPGKGCTQEIYVGRMKSRRIVLPVDRGASDPV